MAIGKRTKKAREGIDPEKAYTIIDAVKLVKERAKAKFDETIEIAMNLGVDPTHGRVAEATRLGCRRAHSVPGE